MWLALCLRQWQLRKLGWREAPRETRCVVGEKLIARWNQFTITYLPVQIPHITLKLSSAIQDSGVLRGNRKIN